MGPWTRVAFECHRIIEDVSGRVRATGSFHRAFGGPIGVSAIGSATAVSAWVPVETLVQVFDKALVPLTVIWGLQGLSGKDVEARWSRGLAMVARGIGLVAVVAILVFTALPRGGQELVSVVVVLLAGAALGAAGAQLLRTQPPAFVNLPDEPEPPATPERPPSLRWVWELGIDSLVVLLTMMGLLAIIFLIEPQNARETTILQWSGGYLAGMGLYRWVAITKWGRSLGGKVCGLEVLQVNGSAVGALRALTRTGVSIMGYALLVVGQIVPLRVTLAIGLAVAGGTIVFIGENPVSPPDLIAGTQVVRTQSPSSRGMHPLYPPSRTDI